MQYPFMLVNIICMKEDVIGGSYNSTISLEIFIAFVQSMSHRSFFKHAKV